MQLRRVNRLDAVNLPIRGSTLCLSALFQRCGWFFFSHLIWSFDGCNVPRWQFLQDGAAGNEGVTQVLKRSCGARTPTFRTFPPPSDATEQQNHPYSNVSPALESIVLRLRPAASAASRPVSFTSRLIIKTEFTFLISNADCGVPLKCFSTIEWG